MPDSTDAKTDATESQEDKGAATQTDAKETAPKADDKADAKGADKGEANASDDAEDFDAERAKAKIAKANNEAKNLRQRIKELESTNEESAKLISDRDAHRNRADLAEAEVTRLKVALRLGLTEVQAKRLVGDTEEELEADAKELLAAFGAPKAPGTKPTPKLRSGAEPDAEPEEMDPAKLAAKYGRVGR